MTVSKTRIKLSAQDKALSAIVAAAKAETDEATSKAILAEGAALAHRWKASHPELPAVTRKVGG